MGRDRDAGRMGEDMGGWGGMGHGVEMAGTDAMEGGVEGMEGDEGDGGGWGGGVGPYGLVKSGARLARQNLH